MTGAQLLNMRNYLGKPDGTYQWDALDGYEGGEKNSLDHHPDLQEKVRDAITNGFIDPDDFNGVCLIPSPISHLCDGTLTPIIGPRDEQAWREGLTHQGV